MFDRVLIFSLLVIAVFTISVPCTAYQSSSFGTASDCSITRVDTKTITWGAQINFKAAFNWKDNSYSNVLADTGSPRLPIAPSKSSCKTTPNSYKAGQSVLVNCTQGF